MDKSNQYERVFQHFHENGDGKLSASELRHRVEAMGGELSAEEAEALVAYLDVDGDGLVDLQDFATFVEDEKEEEKVKGLREAFKMYEMDGSGCITPNSLKRMLSRLGQSMSLHNCQLMISRFDLDGDGVPSFEEFRVMMM